MNYLCLFYLIALIDNIRFYLFQSLFLLPFVFSIQINPVEIEQVVQTLEGVEGVAVVGISNIATHYLACAAVIKRKGYESLTEADIVNYVATKLPPYKQLHGGVIFVEDFPKTPSGKIVKRVLTALAEEKLSSHSRS